MTAIAILGTGAVGTAAARRLRATGHDVTVWNRTADRAAALAEAGARPAASARDAARSGTLLLLPLTDHAAVRDCLAAVDGDLSGRTVVTLATGSPVDARTTAGRVAELGGEFLAGGIQASPEAIAAGTATILYSGSRAAYTRHRPVLERLGTTRFAGERPEAAAVWNLALYGLWYDAQLGLLRALDAVRDAGIDVDAFAGTAGTQLGHVVAGVPGTVAELRDGVYPAGPADLAAHRTVLRHLVELRSGRPLGDGGLPDVVAALDALVAAGHGHEGLTAAAGLRPR